MHQSAVVQAFMNMFMKSPLRETSTPSYRDLKITDPKAYAVKAIAELERQLETARTPARRAKLNHRIESWSSLRG